MTVEVHIDTSKLKQVKQEMFNAIASKQTAKLLEYAPLQLANAYNKLSKLKPIYDEGSSQYKNYVSFLEKIKYLSENCSLIKEQSRVTSLISLYDNLISDLTYCLSIFDRKETLSKVENVLRESKSVEGSILQFKRADQMYLTAHNWSVKQQEVVEKNNFLTSTLLKVKESIGIEKDIKVYAQMFYMYDKAYVALVEAEAVKTQIGELSSIISKLRERDQVALRISELEPLLKEGVCPYCKSVNCNDDMNSNEIKAKREEISVKVQSLRERLAVLNEEIKNANRSLS